MCSLLFRRLRPFGSQQRQGAARPGDFFPCGWNFIAVKAKSDNSGFRHQTEDVKNVTDILQTKHELPSYAFFVDHFRINNTTPTLVMSQAQSPAHADVTLTRFHHIKNTGPTELEIVLSIFIFQNSKESENQSHTIFRQYLPTHVASSYDSKGCVCLSSNLRSKEAQKSL